MSDPVTRGEPSIFGQYVEKIPFHTCWEWIGSLGPGRYGSIFSRESGRTARAHRVVWESQFGPIPEGMFICHHCDNPSCVRPDHLFLGTPADNNWDMVLKGRNRGFSRTNADKTHCAKGHPFTSWTAVVCKDRARRCRLCRRAARSLYKRRNRKRNPEPYA